MAYTRISLRALKVTKRPTFGSKSFSHIERGVQYPGQLSVEEHSDQLQSESHLNSQLGEATDTKDHEHGVYMYPPYDDGQQEPTGYEIESRSNVMWWREIAQSMLEAVTEAYAMEPNQLCDICGNKAVFRCQQCGPFGFCCQDM